MRRREGEMKGEGSGWRKRRGRRRESRWKKCDIINADASWGEPE